MGPQTPKFYENPKLIIDNSVALTSYVTLQSAALLKTTVVQTWTTLTVKVAVFIIIGYNR